MLNDASSNNKLKTLVSMRGVKIIDIKQVLVNVQMWENTFHNCHTKSICRHLGTIQSCIILLGAVICRTIEILEPIPPPPLPIQFTTNESYDMIFMFSSETKRTGWPPRVEWIILITFFSQCFWVFNRHCILKKKYIYYPKTFLKADLHGTTLSHTIYLRQVYDTNRFV